MSLFTTLMPRSTVDDGTHRMKRGGIYCRVPQNCKRGCRRCHLEILCGNGALGSSSSSWRRRRRYRRGRSGVIVAACRDSIGDSTAPVCGGNARAIMRPWRVGR